MSRQAAVIAAGIGIAAALWRRRQHNRCAVPNRGLSSDSQHSPRGIRSRSYLEMYLNDNCRHGMRLPRQKREELETELSLGTSDLLALCVGIVEKWSHCAISGFQVGVAGLANSGDVYFGVNLEFDGVPLACTIHAEQFLVTNLFSGKAEGLKMLVLKYPPCGHCRQFLAETVGTDVVIRLSRGDALQVQAKLSELLPSAFTPSDLGVDVDLLDDRQSNVAMLPLQERRDSIEWARGDEHPSANFVYSGPCESARVGLHGYLVEDMVSDNCMRRLALEAAGRAFAPFTGVCEGVALLTRENIVVVGSTIESAAYNPSLTAIQTALIDTVRRGIPFSDIRRATMVSLQGPSKSAVADAFTGSKGHPESIGYGRELLATVTGLKDRQIRGFMVDNWQPAQ